MGIRAGRLLPLLIRAFHTLLENFDTVLLDRLGPTDDEAAEQGGHVRGDSFGDACAIGLFVQVKDETHGDVLTSLNIRDNLLVGTR